MYLSDTLMQNSSQADFCGGKYVRGGGICRMRISTTHVCHDTYPRLRKVALKRVAVALTPRALGGKGAELQSCALVPRENLACNADNKVAIARAGGIESLVALVRDGTEKQMENAAGALGNLAANNFNNRVAIARAGGIEPLVALARDGTEGQKENAAGALHNLSVNADNQLAIARAGGIAPLVELARGGTEGQKEYAAGALHNLACSNADNQVAIARAGGIQALVELACGGTKVQREHAAHALGILANKDTEKTGQKRPRTCHDGDESGQ